MNTKQIVAKLDKGLRHKSGMTQDKYVGHYCKVLSKYSYATRDDSWNELEKTLTHVLGMLIYHQRFCEILGFKDEDADGFDPRDFVWKYEELQEEKQAEMREWLEQKLKSESGHLKEK